MQYLANLELVRRIAGEIVRDRRCNYNEQQLQDYLQQNQHVEEFKLRIANERNDLLCCSILRQSSTRNKTCIVYLHGLGSNRLEALSIVRAVEQLPYDICSFDFSGSGKSDGHCTTYGVNQSADINCVIKQLIRVGYLNIILWGRSMGGVSAVLYYSKFKNPYVKCMVLDSPFCSFEQVAIELAAKRSIVPQFMINICLEPLKKCLAENYTVNPFTVNITDQIRSVDCNLLFVYSRNDKIVDCSHSMKLIEKCQKQPEKLEILQDHNTIRTTETVEKILVFLEKSLRNPIFRASTERSRSRGISLCSRDSSKEKKNLLQSPISINRQSMKLKPRWPDHENSVKSNSILKSFGSQQLNQRHQTSKTEMDFSPRMKLKTKRAACITSVFFQSQRLPQAPQSEKQNVRAVLNRIQRNKLLRKR